MDSTAELVADATTLVAKSSTRLIANKADQTLNFGGFMLGHMRLALAMSDLREVVPYSATIDLPSPANYIVGGINFRGAIVPVVDLRVVLARQTPAIHYPCVVIMVYDGKIVGLLAESVSGIFSSPASKLNHVIVSDPTAAIFYGSIERPDDAALINILSPKAISQLAQIAMVQDPEPERQANIEAACNRLDDAADAPTEAGIPVMLMRCGSIPLALDAMTVQTTLANPKIEASALAMGHCRGVISYAGVNIPAIDLQSLCGLGMAEKDACTQAFIISLPAGQVAFLIGEVVDVIRTMPQDVMRLPAFALPHPTLFAGALPASVLPKELVERTNMAAGQYLLIDAEAFKTCAEVATLANTNTFSNPALNNGNQAMASASNGGVHIKADQRSMLIYQLTIDIATPLEQIAMILPYSAETSIFKNNSVLLGLMVNRGRSIPVLCLSRICGFPPPAMVTPLTSVLVVESDGELIGFAVPELKTIDSAKWEPELSHIGSGQSDTSPGKSNKLALFGTPGNERMLPVRDLQKIAKAFQTQENVFAQYQTAPVNADADEHAAPLNDVLSEAITDLQVIALQAAATPSIGIN